MMNSIDPDLLRLSMIEAGVLRPGLLCTIANAPHGKPVLRLDDAGRMAAELDEVTPHDPEGPFDVRWNAPFYNAGAR